MKWYNGNWWIIVSMKIDMIYMNKSIFNKVFIKDVLKEDKILFKNRRIIYK
jgi:hypothetical protein